MLSEFLSSAEVFSSSGVSTKQD